MDPFKAQFTGKTFWKNKAAKAWSFICPHCTSPRKIAYQPRPTPQHYAQIALTAAVFTLATWKWFDWKGMVSFIPMWTVFEVFYRTRVRAALLCPHCGFDPYLYLDDVKRARTEIESHWRKKFAEKGVPFPEKEKPLVAPLPPSAGVLLASNVTSKTNH